MKIFNKLFLNLIFIFLFSITYSQNNDIRFSHIGIRDGLSQNSAFCIFQDSRGFLWFGTEAGLNRYDGYNFIIYVPVKDDPYSISNSWIYSVIEDSTGTIWVGTDNGLNAFDPKTEKFTRYLHDPDNSKTISSNRVYTIYQDNLNKIWVGTEKGLNKLVKNKDSDYIFKRYQNDPSNHKSLSNNSVRSILQSQSGKIWIGTDGGGLNLLDTENNQFVRYKNNKANSNSLSDNQVLALYEDKNGILWVGTQNGGLNSYDYKNNIFTHFKSKPNNPNSLTDNWVNCIYEDKSGGFWIGTMDGGLNRFDRNENRFYNYQNNSNNPVSISSNRIFSIFEDNSGVLWIGVYGAGLNKYTKEANSFLHYQSNLGDINSLSNNTVRSFYYDSSDILWVGTDGGGLNKFDKKNQKVLHFRNNPNNKNSISSDRIFSIIEEDSENYWIGTYGGGLNHFNSKTNTFKHYRNNPDDITSLSDNRIRFILPDLPNILWIGTDGSGIDKFNIKTGTFTHYRNNPNNTNSLNNDRIFYILKDGIRNVLWIGTFGGGLDKFDPETEKFTHYEANMNDSASLPNDYVLTICQDNSGMLWLGTNGGGLTNFNPEKETFKSYNVEHGLPNNTIYGILMDKTGKLWMSGNKGLSKFDPQTKSFKKYDVSDGLQGNEFNGGSYYKSKKGILYFGGTNGFNSFDPENIVDNQFKPPILITNFEVLNKKAAIGEPNDKNTILSTSITFTKEIELSYRENVFTFEFSALHYVYPQKNKYAYKLEGFDEDWVYVSSDKRFVSYMNLKPGEYTFRVKGSNNSELWNEEGTSIKITVTPPWWRTNIFYISVIAFIILIIALYIKLREKKLKSEKEKLEKIVKIRTHEIQQQKEEIMSQNEELNQQKEEIMSHRDAIEKQNQELEKLSIVARETDNIVTIMDNEGNMEWVNESFNRIFGYTLNDYIEKYGRNILESSTTDIERIFKECKITKKSVVYESSATSQNGKTTLLQTTLTPILNENDDIIKLITIDTDIQKLKDAENEIKHQNDKIKSSIKYALSIQQSILPIKEIFGKEYDNFIFYKPKDIVSGDFYWHSKIGNYTFFAVIDCTGHGVPGAFMSLIGNRLLNEIVLENKIINPKSILAEMNIKISKALSQKQTKNTNGMDICLCRLEKTSNNTILRFSGAKRPLFIAHTGSKIEILKGDRKTIGGIISPLSNVKFTNQEKTLVPGNKIYLTTDGYADQNNKERKCFGRKRLVKVLEDISDKSMIEQKSILSQKLQEWQQDEIQRDDIAVWGIKI